MADVRAIPMRGFAAAVSRTDRAEPRLQASSVAVGIGPRGRDVEVALSLTHADGTVLTTYLSPAGLDRLANMLADLVLTPPDLAWPAGTMIQ